MTTTLSFTLNTTPVPVNSLYSIHHGRKLLTKRGREKKEEIAFELRTKFKGSITSEEVPLIELGFFFGDNRRRDVDGPIKFIMDAFSGVVYEDDSQLKSIRATKHIDKTNPRIEVTIHYG